MKKKITKKINEKARSLLIEWLKSLVEEDEVNQITKENFKSFLPKDRYMVIQRTHCLSFYTFRWATQNIKKLVKKGMCLDRIELEDLQWLLRKPTKTKQSSIL